MAKVNKTKLAVALLSFYQSAYDFNVIAGKSIKPEYAKSQDGLVIEETKEGIIARIEKDEVLSLDGLIDCLVTASFRVLIMDGNTDLLKDHSGIFDSETCVEDLWGNLLSSLLKEDWINVLQTAEDLLYRTDPNAIHNLYEVATSNMSKYVPVALLDDPEDMCDKIESEGRYTGVEYHISKAACGQEFYVFTATYDIKEKRAFDKPKIVKPVGFFKEPQLLVG